MKSVQINEDIRKALLAFQQDSGMNQEEICARIGISRTTWCAWVNRNNNNDYSYNAIKPKNWSKIFPFIQNYLPPEYIFADGARISASGGSVAMISNRGGIHLNGTQDGQIGKMTKNMLDEIMANQDLDDKAKLAMIKLLSKE